MHEEPLICFQIFFKLKKVIFNELFAYNDSIPNSFILQTFAQQNFLGRLTCSYKTKAEPTASFMCLDTARANLIQY